MPWTLPPFWKARQARAPRGHSSAAAHPARRHSQGTCRQRQAWPCPGVCLGAHPSAGERTGNVQRMRTAGGCARTCAQSSAAGAGRPGDWNKSRMDHVTYANKTFMPASPQSGGGKGHRRTEGIETELGPLRRGQGPSFSSHGDRALKQSPDEKPRVPRAHLHTHAQPHAHARVDTRLSAREGGGQDSGNLAVFLCRDGVASADSLIKPRVFDQAERNREDELLK